MIEKGKILTIFEKTKFAGCGICLSVLGVISFVQSAPASATERVALYYADGPSVPGIYQNGINFSSQAISRIGDGETFSIHSSNDAGDQEPKATELTSAFITAFSKSGSGKILVRDAWVENSLIPKDPPIPLSALENFEAGDKAQDYNGNVMLTNGQSVKMVFPRPVTFTDLHLTVEAFGSDDASFLIALDSTDQEADKRYIQVNRTIVSPPTKASGSTPFDPSGGVCGSCGGNYSVCVHQTLGWTCVLPGINEGNQCSSNFDCDYQNGYSCTAGACIR